MNKISEPLRKEAKERCVKNDGIATKIWPNGMYLVRRKPLDLREKVDIRDQPLEELLRRRN